MRHDVSFSSRHRAFNISELEALDILKKQKINKLYYLLSYCSIGGLIALGIISITLSVLYSWGFDMSVLFISLGFVFLIFAMIFSIKALQGKYQIRRLTRMLQERKDK